MALKVKLTSRNGRQSLCMYRSVHAFFKQDSLDSLGYQELLEENP